MTRKQFSILKAQLTLCTSILFCLWCQYTILHRYYPDVSIYHLSSNFKEGSLQRNNIQRHHINYDFYRFEFEGFWIDSSCLVFEKYEFGELENESFPTDPETELMALIHLIRFLIQSYCWIQGFDISSL